MAIFGPNIDSILFSIAIAALPASISLARRIQAYYTQKRSEPPPTIPPSQQRLLRALGALVLLHSVYILWTILFDAPINIFTALRLPLTTPASTMRSRLLEHASSSNDTLPPQTEALLTRLQSIDVRGYYVRFGHDTVQQCDFCRNFWDFGVFMLPGVALQYMRTLILGGILTIPGSGKRYLRGWFTAALVLAGFGELWFLTTVEIAIKQDVEGTTMWADRAWYIRQTLFLLAPLILHIMPYQTNPYAPLASAPYALRSVENTLNSLGVLETVRIASLREDKLRRRVSEYWEHSSMTAKLAREDEEIREEAERAGMPLAFGNDEGEGEGATPRAIAIIRAMVGHWRERLVGLMSSPPIQAPPSAVPQPTRT